MSSAPQNRGARIETVALSCARKAVASSAPQNRGARIETRYG